MCRAVADGGRRCSLSVTADRRRVVMQRAKRREAAGDVEAAAGDRLLVERLDAARERYGSFCFDHVMAFPEPVEDMFVLLSRRGLSPLVVGGSVRDSLLGDVAPKDIDVEVYGTSLENMRDVLRREGFSASIVGAQFGVLTVRLSDGTDLDLSVPRRDNLTGTGHRGFTVEVDESMGVVEAASRRDFTFNAIGFDPVLQVAVDPYHGREDLEAGRMRVVSDAFGEDPLRVLRGFQFAGRFGVSADEGTVVECRNLLPRAGELPVERLRKEWRKFATLAVEPGKSLGFLRETGWDSVYGLDGVGGDDVAGFDEAVARAVAAARAEGLDAEARERLITGVVAAHVDGLDAREGFVGRAVEGGDAQRMVVGTASVPPPMGSGDEAARRFAGVCADNGTTVREWARLHRVLAPEEAGEVDGFVGSAVRLGCVDGRQVDMLAGRDILEVFGGRRPGPWVGVVQRQAREAQLAGRFTSREGGLVWLREQPEPT